MKIFWLLLIACLGILLGIEIAHAQIARAQILRDEDANLVVDRWHAYMNAKQDYETAVEMIKTKYHLDFDPVFSNDFKVAVPKPPTAVLYAPEPDKPTYQ